ncbi:MAG TPA: adenylate/guanylate cyclase domain-containing protein [Acidimicrobiia bacterium]|nr:adenylate/guanylate cyclase domain-containing protein [Acidimicrobiia bacterium]
MTALRALPTGTVTFVFSDIEGSTRLIQQLGDAYRSVLERHHAIVETAVTAAGGVVVDFEGDGAFLAFGSALAALSCVTEIQRTLAAEQWPSDASVRARMGVHTGEGRQGASGYVGLDVHRAARIAASGHGGQVVMSEATARLAEYDLPDGTYLEDLGTHSLKDLVHEEHLYQLSIAGLPREFPPLATSTGIKGNLPNRTVSFVGRRDEINRVAEAVAQDRLVTLTGPAGVGKTALALAVAPQMSAQFPDGVWFVEATRVDDEAALAMAVAHQLRITGNAEQDLVETVAARLMRARALLVLDGCEHLIGAVAHLAETILGSTREVHVLVTSRERLSIRGEVVVHVVPLAVPDEPDLLSTAELASYESVALFVARAEAVQPDFKLTEQNAPAIAEICRRLDGIPLALELAAARLKMLSPWQLVERLDHQFALLAGRHRDVPPHQQTLETTLDWSHDALSPLEQVVFARLSVFAGSFSIEAAEEVCSGGKVDRHRVLDLLERLVETSLVETVGSDPVRYRLLEPIRYYASTRLELHEDSQLVRSRHAEFYTALAEQADLELHGLDQMRWIVRLDRARDNLRAALRHLDESGNAGGVLRLAGALRWFWVIRRDVGEGWWWLERGLEDRTDSLPEHVARALSGLGLLAIRRLDFATAHRALTEARDIYRRSGDSRSEAHQAYHLATLAWFRDEPDEADELAATAEEMSRNSGDHWSLAWILAMGGTMARLHGDLGKARRLMDESHEVFVRHTGILDQGWSHLRLGALARDEGRYELATFHYSEGRALLADAGDMLGVSHADAGLGAMAWLGGNHEHAIALFLSVLEGFRLSEEVANNLFELKTMIQGNLSASELQAVVQSNRERAELSGDRGARTALGEYVYHIGSTAFSQRQFDRACEALIESLTLSASADDRRGVSLALRGLASTFHAIGDWEAAATMLGAASTGSAVPPARGHTDSATILADVRANLGESAAESAHEAGARLSPNDAAERAWSYLAGEAGVVPAGSD